MRRRRTDKRRVAAAAALCGALAGVLAGCGVEPTDVIEVGQPAQGAKQPGAPVREVRLYFGFPGGLEPRSRPAAGEVGAEEAVALLLQGPNEAERMQGLFTDLPKLPQSSVVVATVPGTVTIRLPLDPTRLSAIARNQLVCTASHNGVPDDRRPEDVKVDLMGNGKGLKNLVCDNELLTPRVGSSPAPAPSTTPAP
ncbi:MULTISPECIES: hypothetical protein [Streptomyces]|uniref:GerMN domain-containing protein n=3 Tax=Streptomyces TaxID=1883 RepID=A0A3Q9G0C3_STRLT|nr:hypothetical protein [Streptomyces luteoverticillatus]AZQ74522.1 hypothetical protein EKH77_27885 [Streptomyces luteoverticillatus]